MTITAKVIADSISEHGKRITTFELEYPRFIHAEFMTHRLLSRNAASSRAIPVAKQIEQIETNCAMPVHWGANRAGMSAKEECCNLITLLGSEYNEYKLKPESAWFKAACEAITIAEGFAEAGYHKQIVNRLLEPFQHIKVVCTATEYDNFFYLRKHPDAQPEIQKLAEEMWKALQESQPELLKAGEWHTPYVKTVRLPDGHRIYCKTYSQRVLEDNQLERTWTEISLEDALKVSASCCAQVSYRKNDTSLEKALDIYDKLVSNKPVHASPFEHQASPMGHTKAYNRQLEDWERGVTHCDALGDNWSGNFKAWIQYRQLIPDNVCNNYKENV